MSLQKKKTKEFCLFFMENLLQKMHRIEKNTVYVDECMNRKEKRLYLWYYLISIMLCSVPHYLNNWPILYIFTFFNTE